MLKTLPHFFSWLLMSCSAWAAETDTHSLAGSPLTTANLLNTLLGLILVLATIVIMVWLLKRTQQFNTGVDGQLKVLAGIPLGTRERAMLLQIGEEQVLVGVTAQQVTLLYKLESPLTISPKKAAFSGDFANKLRDALKQGKA
jgi:flagellar protein FliO/FliZ